MHVAVYVPLLLPLLLTPGLRSLGRWIAPRAASWLQVLGGALLTGTILVSLALLSLAGLLGWTPLAGWDRWSAATLRAVAPVPPAMGAVAAVLLGYALTAAPITLLRWRRRQRAASAAVRGSGSTLVVLDEAEPLAYAVPGGPGHLVVSRGMLRALDSGARRALLAHERAHLTCRHHLFVATVRVLSAANPLLLPLRPTIAYSTERWADEIAAAAAGRTVTARAISTAALLTNQPSPAATLAIAAGPVPLRVAALLGDNHCAQLHRPRRPILLLAGVLTTALLGLTTTSALDALSDMHENLDTAACANLPHQHCPNPDTGGPLQLAWNLLD